ncbi:MAG: beta-lactamase family protein [Armatimonadetes bacterium]|nr:beta-lactamase family protein [Armatimonadota bacterium]
MSLVCAKAPLPDPFDPIRKEISVRLEAKTLPSFAIAVVKGGKVIWEEGFGFSDIENRKPANPHTIYAIASVSKSITSTAAYILSRQGKLNLNEKLGVSLRGSKRTWLKALANVTPIELMDMRGGLPHLWFFEWSDEADAPSCQDLLDKYAFVAFEPGSTFHYSNLSLGALGGVLEERLRRPLFDVMKTTVFDPLGMNRTFLRIPKATDNVAKRYNRAGSYMGSFNLEPAGGAGYYSTAHDLALYMLYHLGAAKPGLPSTILNDVHGKQGYHYGWGNGNDLGITSAVSDGNVVGGSAFIKILPSEGVGVVGLSNYSGIDGFVQHIVEETAFLAVPGYRERSETARKGRQLPEDYRESKFIVDEAMQGVWKGAIRVDRKNVPISITFNADGSAVVMIDGKSAPASDLVLDGTTVRGRVEQALPTTAFAEAHALGFFIKRFDSKITGYFMAESQKARSKFGLPFFVSLSKEHQ